MSGPLSLKFDLAGRGRSRQQLLRALTGEAQLTMPAGGRLPIDLQALLADARERKSMPFGAHAWRPASFEFLEARLAVRYGSIVSEHLALRSDGQLMKGDGSLHAIAGQIYLRLMMDHGHGLARTARLGRSQSVLIHGDLANPTVTLEEPVGAQTPASAALPAPAAVARP